jgi:hypothetical protein
VRCELIGIDLSGAVFAIEIVERPVGQHGARACKHVVRLRESVAVLDQQPLLALRRAHEREEP